MPAEPASSPGPSSRHAGRVAIYPGSFDPLTNGHVDIITRGLGVFDRIIVAILVNRDKSPVFSADERIAMTREVFGGEGRVEVDTFDGLLVDYARRRGAHVIVRGLRAISDFEVEIQLAHNNRKLAPDIDTVFFMTSLEHGYVSSSLVKEIARFGGDVSGMVPPAAETALAGHARAAGQSRG